MNKLITKQDILDLNPCHSIEKYNITKPISLISILERDDVESSDKLWLVTHFLTDKTNRLFAVWCARQVLTKDSDYKVIEACNVAERYANGEATDAELDVARATSRSASRSAAWAAESASWSAAWAAAEVAAKSVWAAAESAESAESAAEATVWAASESAAESAESASKAAQTKQLIKMLNVK